MTLRPLFPPMPPGCDPADPSISAWRVERLEQEVTGLDIRLQSVEARSSTPSVDWTRVIAVGGLILMGALGRISPEQVKSGIKMLFSL